MRLWSIMVWIGLPLLVIGQEANLRFTHYTTANGLPDNAVRSMLQDSRGFMWFATQEGLARFDGRQFRVYQANPEDSNALHHNLALYLREYKPGHLLFLSNGELTGLNTLTHTFYRPMTSKINALFGYAPKDSTGYFLFGTDTCLVVDAQFRVTDTLVPPSQQKPVGIMAYAIDAERWLVTTGTAHFIYRPGLRSYHPLSLQFDLPKTQDLWIFRYYQPAEGLLYFSNYWNGLFAFDLDGRLQWRASSGPEGQRISSNNLSHVEPLADGRILIGNQYHGLNIVDKTHNQSVAIRQVPGLDDGLISDAISLTYTDRQGNLWVATDRGVSRWVRQASLVSSWKPDEMTLSPDIPFSGSVTGPDGQQYISRFGASDIWQLNPQTGRATPLLKGQLPPTWWISRFGDSLVFSGVGTRVGFYNPETAKLHRTDFLRPYFANAEVVVLAFRDSHGDAWYSGNNGGGFVRVEAGSGIIHHYPKDGPRGRFSISYYTCYAEDIRGDLWFGVNKTNRLLHWQRKTNQFRELALDTVAGTRGIMLHGITDLATDREKNLWIAFDGSGLVKYDPRRHQSRYYSMQHGLLSNYVNSLVFDARGRLWAATTRGLNCLQPDASRFVQFTRHNGLPLDYFGERNASYDSGSNRLWIGSRGSLLYFNPDSLLAIFVPQLRIYVDEVLVNGRRHAAKDHGSMLRLEPGENYLQFSFAAADLGNGNAVEFSYRLRGITDTWTPASHSAAAIFAALPHGRYQLELRGRHVGQEVWAVLDQPLVFVIAASWYQTVWFRLTALTMLIAILYLAIKEWLRRQWQKQTMAMEKELAVEQERNRLARELHDGLGSMISGIRHAFAALRRELSLSRPQQASFDYHLSGLDNTLRELRSISHSMASASLQGGLEASIRDYCRNLGSPDGLQITFQSYSLDHLTLPDEEAFHLFRIVQELLQNIISHAGATEAMVQLSRNDHRLYITVEDNGRGFDLPQARGGMGLQNIASRVKLLRGHVDIRSIRSEGTSVMVDIPLPPG